MKILQLRDVDRLLRAGDGARVDEDIQARFKVGDEVLARNFQTMGHTRLPRYVRSRRGVIAIDHGCLFSPIRIRKMGIASRSTCMPSSSVCVSCGVRAPARLTAFISTYLTITSNKRREY